MVYDPYLHIPPYSKLIIARTNNATIEVIIEEAGFNNSLAGSLNCPNSNTKADWKGARNEWIEIYLQDGMALNED